MPSIRRIVAATDFSDFAERVVRRAAHVAKRHDADLHLLHVVRPMDLYPSLVLAQEPFGDHDRELREAQHSRLGALAEEIARQFGVRVETTTRLGRPHSEIATHAQAVSADLVVAGARGENTLMDLFLGSTVSRLLRLTSCPVLIVRKPADEPYREVLAAVDFAPMSAAVVEYAISLADGARVEAVHILGSEAEQRLRRAKNEQVDITAWLAGRRTEAEKHLDALLASIERGEAVARRIESGYPPAAICQCIEDRHVDLVVLARHGHGGGLEDWLLGSVSKDVSLAASCDVLLVGTGSG